MVTALVCPSTWPASVMQPASMSTQQAPAMTPEEQVAFLEEIWAEDDGIQEMISEDDWNAFIEKVRNAE